LGIIIVVNGCGLVEVDDASDDGAAVVSLSRLGDWSKSGPEFLQFVEDGSVEGVTIGGLGAISWCWSEGFWAWCAGLS